MYSTPLPRSQVAVLMGVRLAEPIAYTVIFPFINEMIEELKVTDNPERVGFYSGLVESVFAFVQVFTVYHWAKLSDRIGRKPVIVVGLMGVVISSSLFGLATNFWAMLFFRCMSGALNGNVAVIKASLGDITDETNSTDAFAMYGLTWTLGSIIGNAMGGSLSHPVERFPALFEDSTLFRVHPFLFPCLVSACCTFIGVIFAAFVYRESLPTLSNRAKSSSFSLKLFSPMSSSHKRQLSLVSTTSDSETLVAGLINEDDVTKTSASAEANLLQNGESSDGRTNPWGFWQLLSYRPVRISSTVLFLNSFVNGSWGAVSILFFYDKSHGLGMSASAIGSALAINGCWSIGCQMFFLTRIRRALGLKRAFNVLESGWILVWLTLPLLRGVLELSEVALPPDETGLVRYPDTRGWVTSIAVNVVLCFVTMVTLGNSLLMVVVNASSPDRSALGAVNGLSTAVGCMARVIGPSIVSALFAISMDGQVIGGRRLWWLFMTGVSVLAFCSSLLIDEEVGNVQYRAVCDEEEYQD